MLAESIDVTFDFTTDTPLYWVNFWENNNGLGAGSSDPDSVSKTLQNYQKSLYSRVLPIGETMNLKIGLGSDYLTWNGFRFGSDSITTGFRYNKYNWMIENVKKTKSDYREYMEDYIRKTYTIGGNIIFPKRKDSINQRRGCDPRIRDRWDLTLECIRRFFYQEENPLSETLEKDKNFFELFIDFKGYVDFFFLQDCVTDDYSKVLFWTDINVFRENPLPRTVQEYLDFIEHQKDFVNRRNERIRKFVQTLKDEKEG